MQLLTIWLWLSLTPSVTCSLTCCLTCSLTCSLGHTLSDMLSLTLRLWWSLKCSLWYALCNMFSLTRSLWHVLSGMLSLDTIFDNRRKLSCIFHYRSVVHISAYIHSPLESISFNNPYNGWFLHRRCFRIYRTPAMGFWYQNTVPFVSIFIELTTHPHPYPSISSKSAMSWYRRSQLFVLASDTISHR